jgi:hypothetical protein
MRMNMKIWRDTRDVTTMELMRDMTRFPLGILVVMPFVGFNLGLSFGEQRGVLGTWQLALIIVVYLAFVYLLARGHHRVRTELLVRLQRESSRATKMEDGNRAED